jgi:hypothetical protein
MKQDETKILFISKYNTFGSEKFYKFLLDYAGSRIGGEKTAKNPSPEIELMGYYDKFLALYRKENEQIYLEIAKLFRRASNKIYRTMLKVGVVEKSDKFLNVVE